MDKYRLLFEKTDRAIYISHLDLMHTMQRAFNRAELRLKYSEGFNPHPQISIALPLSVGMASHCEIMDFKLADDVAPQNIPGLLNPVFPEGIRVLDCYEPVRKTAEIKWLRIKAVFEYDDRDAGAMAQALSRFFEREEICIEKRTKRGMGMADIKQAIQEIRFTAEGTDVSVSALISAQEPTLNPEHLVSALRQLQPEIAPDFAKFTRMELYDQQMQQYR